MGRRNRDATINVMNALQVWFSEFDNFNYDNDINNGNGEMNEETCDPNTNCGHFTSSIWAKTTKVGCAITKCHFEKDEITYSGLTSGEIMICHYYPKGNKMGQKPWSNLPKDECKNKSSKYNNLCDNETN